VFSIYDSSFFEDILNNNEEIRKELRENLMQEFFESSNDAAKRLYKLIMDPSKYSESSKMKMFLQVSDELARIKIEIRGPADKNIPTVRRNLETLILSDKDGQDTIDFYISEKNKEDKRKTDYFPRKINIKNIDEFRNSIIQAFGGRLYRKFGIRQEDDFDPFMKEKIKKLLLYYKGFNDYTNFDDFINDEGLEKLYQWLIKEQFYLFGKYTKFIDDYIKEYYENF